MKKTLLRKSAQANTGNVVFVGQARFTILTDRMIRMEYAEDALFEDRRTLAVCNRSLKIPSFDVTSGKDRVTIRTKSLVLDYRETGRGFSAANLQVKFRLNGKWSSWRHGQKDPLNLGGTVRTLDGAIGHEYWLWKQNEQGHWAPNGKIPIDLGHGFISRSGWAVYDDSRHVVLDPRPDSFTPWASTRPAGKRHDQYFLGYGHDFKAALADAALVFGQQPLPPRYVLGYWYSRYWAYTDREIENMIDQFDRMKLPIDVMVIDMDWHLQGWTGYTWDRDYFPDPTALLRDLRKRGIKITLNLHPADGVGKHEAAFADMCRDLGLDPKKTDRIPFDCTDPKFMEAYFKHLHHPEEKRGVDFWWLDWQQGSKTKVDGLDPLPWLNHLHWHDQMKNRPQQRPLNFSRYGGPGSGRYPVGFSGDTHSTWESLAYQPYFTATASNVLYGTWSHDIGGHQPGPIGAELYTRWIQFGAYSPILRTHTSKNREAERRVWLYPEPHRDIMIEALMNLADASEKVAMITPSDYLARHPEGHMAVPSASSWGARGYHDVWLNDSTAWMYPHLFRAAERAARLESSASDQLEPEMKARLLAQARREILLGQSSDWPFMMNAGRHVEYAEKRVRDHLTRFYWLADALESGNVNEAKLAAIETADNIFPNASMVNPA